MSIIAHNFQGSNGSLPAGVSQIAPTAAIQSNQLQLTSVGSSTIAAASISTLSWGSIAEQWHQYDVILSTSTVAGYTPIINAGFTDYIGISMFPAANEIAIVTDSGQLENESFDIVEGDTYRVRVHIVYGASGLIEVWAWRPGTDVDPSDGASIISYSGNTTISSPASTALVTGQNFVGGTTTTTFDSLVIRDDDPPWSENVIPVYDGLEPDGEFEEGGVIELGTWFDNTETILAHGIRIWGHSNPDTITDDRYMKLWDRTDTDTWIALKQLPDTIPTGWVEYYFDAPVELPPGEWAVSANFIRYTGRAFGLNGTIGDGIVDYHQGYGRYNLSAGTFPELLFNDNYYFVDLLYSLSEGEEPEVKSTVGTISLALSASGAVAKVVGVTGAIELALDLADDVAKSGVTQGAIGLTTSLSGTVSKEELIVKSTLGSIGMALGLSGSTQKAGTTQGSVGLTLGLSGIAINPENIVQRPDGFTVVFTAVPEGVVSSSIPQGVPSWTS